MAHQPGPVRVGLAPAPVSFDVVLRPRNEAALATLAEQVASPSSPLYRHYLAPGEFARRFGASPARLADLEAELRSDGFRPEAVLSNHLGLEVGAGPGGLSAGVVAGPAGPDANLAGGINLANLSHLGADVEGLLGLNDAHLGTNLETSLPVATVPHLAVSGGPSPSPACSSDMAASYGEDGAGLTADQVADAYGLSGVYANGDLASGVTVALIEYAPFSAGDVATYAACYGLNPNIETVKVEGGPSLVDPTGEVEAALDIEDLIGLAPDANVMVYEGPSHAGAVSYRSAYETLERAVNDDRAEVITTSWGTCEPVASNSYASAENTLFEQAALQGQTVLAAAGDDGSEDCYGMLHSRRADTLAVDDPASQPFVTGVGGTALSFDPTKSESVWNNSRRTTEPGAGGGGVSRIWAMPGYQRATPAVPGELGEDGVRATCGAHGGMCREVPDVSADAGSPYAVYCTNDALMCSPNGWTGLGGTSAAAPTWAAIAALADASPMCVARGPVGFMNPTLYRIASGPLYASDFDDITVGNNDLTGSNHGQYSAGSGYDLASGLGTPVASDPGGGGLVADLCTSGVRAAPRRAGTLRLSSATAARSQPDGATTVVIRGSGLEGATSVAFGASPARAFRVLSDDRLETTAPPGSGVVTVTVMNAASSTRATVAFRYPDRRHS